MNKQKEVNEALKEVKKILEQKGMDVVYLAIQGSTNYELDVYSDSYKSDFDMKAFVMPTFEDLYYNRFTSKTYEQPYGQVTVHDIRMLPELMKKANPSYLEILFTPYYMVNKDYEDLIHAIRTRAVYMEKERFALLIKSMHRMILEKQKALCKGFEDSDKYDFKQLHHAYRLLYMMDAMLHGASYASTLVLPEHIRKDLIDIKLNGAGTKEEAVQQMEDVVQVANSLCNMIWNKETKAPFDKYILSNKEVQKWEDAIFHAVHKKWCKETN